MYSPLNFLAYTAAGSFSENSINDRKAMFMQRYWLKLSFTLKVAYPLYEINRACFVVLNFNIFAREFRVVFNHS